MTANKNGPKTRSSFVNLKAGAEFGALDDVVVFGDFVCNVDAVEKEYRMNACVILSK